MSEPTDNPDKNATVLHVGNLDMRVTDSMMLNILRTGLDNIKDRIRSACIYPNDVMHPGEGYCFIQFEDNEAASTSMAFLNGREFCGKKVKVSWATNSTTGGMPKLIGTSVSIYCGNLDDDITEDDLQSAFDPFGEIINIKVVRDPATNRSKNIAFISFTNKPDAERAIREMHGAMLKTRPIKTNWATRNQNPKKEEQDYDTVYKGAADDNTTVYAGGIPTNCSDEQIRAHFEDYGTISDIRIFAAKNYAFIKYDTHAAAATAICKTNGSELYGSCLKCWWGKDGDAIGPSNHGGSSYNNRNNYSGNNNGNTSNYVQQQNNHQEQNPSQMTVQQQQQYMQYMQCHPYYQQQYYQYWMQQYQQQQQQQMQNGGTQQPAAQQQAAAQQAFNYQQQQQQQSGYSSPQSYQNH